jgi:hypothetical protein
MAHALEIAGLIEATLDERPFLKPLLAVFPRDIVKLASYGFEIPIVRQPNLSVRSARHYLCLLGGSTSLPRMPTQERRLFGLLHIGPPSNVILLDTSLSTRMSNYVVAHELGHFVSDLLLIRQRWLQHLPGQHAEIVSAFEWRHNDGMLELQALIRGLPPRPRPILARGREELLQTAAIERHADLVARELLAPWRLVLPLAQQRDQSMLSVLLRRDFGLPKYIADSYAEDLLNACAPRDDLIDRLFSP